ncbi:hypothetical protein T12_9280 [Trichinella patagoniensis]|uniref:Uncharacterized protein n=1 Tax=Trichinella patagoniensis TaxID=990121 RepID=A0A0V0ZH13_9BILA|nr:hypothetical protein T12_9280 [Trichinella patagoniensis]
MLRVTCCIYHFIAQNPSGMLDCFHLLSLAEHIFPLYDDFEIIRKLFAMDELEMDRISLIRNLSSFDIPFVQTSIDDCATDRHVIQLC